jgi:hypothetical protein
MTERGLQVVRRQVLCKKRTIYRRIWPLEKKDMAETGVPLSFGVL